MWRPETRVDLHPSPCNTLPDSDSDGLVPWPVGLAGPTQPFYRARATPPSTAQLLSCIASQMFNSCHIPRSTAPPLGPAGMSHKMSGLKYVTGMEKRPVLHPLGMLDWASAESFNA